MATRIYTRTGDSGHTGLFGGERVPKDDPRVEACGSVDELNTALGLARVHPEDMELDALLAVLQHELFVLGSDLATPSTNEVTRGRTTVHRIDSNLVHRLETVIDEYEREVPPLTNFILPGGHRLAAQLHWCRAVCRRAERRCVTLLHSDALSGSQGVNPLTVHYLNRLSDLLFVLARVANHRRHVDDVVWNPV